MSAQWKSELDNVVLEVPDENNPKISNDSERCSWNQLLSELSDSGISDATINSHELSTPIVEGGKDLDHSRALEKVWRVEYVKAINDVWMEQTCRDAVFMCASSFQSSSVFWILRAH
ncbi:unnamed protein product [Durusdinium trenchii]|uniref:Uncharacterized protein n=1 Tax=Durusdinium trenchii TaxID=1381693 RepID=A0ABP0T0P2_9DINO